MDEAKRELVQQWLKKAHHDLLSAQWLAEAPTHLLDTAIYHCQQAAEKSIKAVLVFHDQPFEKTHDVGAVLTQATSVEPSLSAVASLADRLTRYAFVFRYPSGSLEPTAVEFDQALRSAETIFATVLGLLPSSVHP